MLRYLCLLVALFIPLAGSACGSTEEAKAAGPANEEIVNSLGMKLVLVPAGSFAMGTPSGGDFDERPVHKVTIGRPFLMSATEVSNAQYEQFDPAHKPKRLKESPEDNAAVTFVSWHDAVRFCEWLSKKESKPYRLPTEAEWEYACRAGTTTAFSTGDAFPKQYHKNQVNEWGPKPVSLTVASTSGNPWGLHDMHGNVEEWCADWYGPYAVDEQTNPLGHARGEFRVTRGGSHNTEVAYLRSANRLGTLPDDKHWMIGFRVVQAEPPEGKPLSAPVPPRWACDVKQTVCDWSAAPDAKKPYFLGPRRFVHIPAGSSGPLFSAHNHQPSITWCPNGDLLAAWFSTNSESGRELSVVASRLRRAQDAWEPAEVFFKAPDRNMTGSSLWNDGQGTLYHFNGLGHASGWALLAITLRTSQDNGATWSAARLIVPEHNLRRQVISGTLRTSDGTLIQPCDAVPGGSGGTAVWLSGDRGQTWTDPGADAVKPDFAPGATGGWIAGIHAGVVELPGGRLMALARGDNLRGRMPKSLSQDRGKTWTYSPSLFPPIAGGQRLALLRLREGPLLLASFTDASGLLRRPSGMTITDAAGKQRAIYGLFTALSFDDGETWPVRRLVTDDKPAHKVEGGSPGRDFTMDTDQGEFRGYLTATQSPDGIVHLLSSAQHYAFNLAWLKAAMPAEAGNE